MSGSIHPGLSSGSTVTSVTSVTSVTPSPFQRLAEPHHEDLAHRILLGLRLIRQMGMLVLDRLQEALKTAQNADGALALPR